MNISVVARMCRQSVEYAPAESLDSRGDRTWGAPQVVQARKVLKSKDLIGKDQEVVTATAQFTLLFAPAIGDLLDGREVIRVDAMTDYTGSVVGWMAYTR